MFNISNTIINICISILHMEDTHTQLTFTVNNITKLPPGLPTAHTGGFSVVSPTRGGSNQFSYVTLMDFYNYHLNGFVESMKPL